MQEVLNSELLGNSVLDYLLALGTIVVGAIAIKLVDTIVVNRVKRWARRTSTTLDDDLIRLIERFVVPALLLGVVYIGLNGLTLHPILDQAVDIVFVILITVAVVRLLGTLVEYSIQVYAAARRPGDQSFQYSLNALTPAIKIIIWAIGLVFLLENFGLDISAIVAGLGIGGVAIALASQGVLQDLFSYFSILFDRPFEIGDFIVVGDCVGTVEYIGIKTTRMRSIDGEQLVVANTDLTASRIRNYKRMLTRRIVFQIGVTYETGLEQLKAIPTLIKDVIDQTETVTFDRAHFLSYGDFSLNFEVVYIVNTGDYAVYMDAQQAINLGLKQVFDERGIEFAYPTQVTYLSGATDSDGFTSSSDRLSVSASDGES
jgi:small-conductance mechanosensitive channel